MAARAADPQSTTAAAAATTNRPPSSSRPTQGEGCSGVGMTHHGKATRSRPLPASGVQPKARVASTQSSILFRWVLRVSVRSGLVHRSLHPPAVHEEGMQQATCKPESGPCEPRRPQEGGTGVVIVGADVAGSCLSEAVAHDLARIVARCLLQLKSKRLDPRLSPEATSLSVGMDDTA